MVLEPDKLEQYKIIEAASRNSKIYKDLSGGEMCLLQKEADELQVLRDKLMANNVCKDLIQDVDVEYEVPGLIQLEDEWWKLKADIKNNTELDQSHCSCKTIYTDQLLFLLFPYLFLRNY